MNRVLMRACACRATFSLVQRSDSVMQMGVYDMDRREFVKAGSMLWMGAA